jgi:hypothetical protein
MSKSKGFDYKSLLNPITPMARWAGDNIRKQFAGQGGQGGQMPSSFTSNLPNVEGYNRTAIPLMNEYSRDQLRNYMQQISPYTTGAIDTLGQRAGGQGGMDEYKKAMISRYQQEDLPSIMQQYGGQGSGRSSGMQNALAAGAQNLGQNLAARREDMQSQAIQQLLGLNSDFMNMKDYEHGFSEIPESMLSKFMTKGLPAAADLAGTFMGYGPVGTYAKTAVNMFAGGKPGAPSQMQGASAGGQTQNYRPNYGLGSPMGTGGSSGGSPQYNFAMPQSSFKFGADR